MGLITRKLSKFAITKYADSGPLPGRYTTHGSGVSDLHEILDKNYFALEVPKPSQASIDALPPLDDVLKLFERPQEEVEGDSSTSRVSLLLPFMAQHLTDAVFQSADQYATEASHEIVLNQVYGNTAEDQKALRASTNGELKTQKRMINGKEAEYPDALCHEVNGTWEIKPEYSQLSYLQDEDKLKKLLAGYKGKEGDICAVGLFQGNMTIGNFALTALLVREHNRLCRGIAKELGTNDNDTIFNLARRNNIVAYMKVVIEDYINAFAGLKLFKMDTKNFFYEVKRWCRATPIPYHFNILYRIHSMIPSKLVLNGQNLGFKEFLANNGVVMSTGLGEVFQSASGQAASKISLRNTHPGLMPAERASLIKARQVLGSFNAHREVNKKGSSLSFKDFDPSVREELERLYKDVDKVEYSVGILAELPGRGLIENLGIKSDSLMGTTLMDAIAKHAFRHILSNPLMRREFLNADAMTRFGWQSLENTSTIADLVTRNVPELGDEAKALRISFAAPGA